MAATGDICPIEEIRDPSVKVSETQLLDLARLAEAAERYSDMAFRMKQIVEQKIANIPDPDAKPAEKTLDVEPRNLFSVAYKNVIGAVRSSWRTITSGQFSDVDPEALEMYKVAIEKKMKAICLEVLALLGSGSDQSGLLGVWDNLKVSDTKDAEARIFYMKMRGDYYRYLSEFDPQQDYKDGAKGAYQNAMDLAENSLPETHPTRLGLALNFSVCHYEILKEPEKACALAKKAFDAAIEKLDTLNDASYKDSTLIMQLLRDNLTLWTSENNQETEENNNP